MVQLPKFAALYSWLFCSALFLAPAILHAQFEPRIGISAFGIQSENFQGEVCDQFLATIRPATKPAVAILFETFGDNPTCLERYWKQTEEEGETHFTEIHFSNEAGRRMHFLDKKDFMYEYSFKDYNALLEEMPAWFEAKVRSRVRSIVKLIEPAQNNGIFLLSTGLEDNYTTLAWENLRSVIITEWPHEIVRNPALTQFMSRQRWRAHETMYEETHGYHRRLDHPLCVANGDGQDITFLKDSGKSFGGTKPADMRKVKKWLQRARASNCITFLWAAKWQGIFLKDKKRPRPLSREFVYDREDVRRIRNIFRYYETLDPNEIKESGRCEDCKKKRPKNKGKNKRS